MIDGYWSVFVDPDGRGSPCHWVLPDGCYTLSIGISPTTYVTLRPPSLAAFRAPCSEGQRVIGVRFRPAVDPRRAFDQLKREIRNGQSPEEIFSTIQRCCERELREPDPRASRLVAYTRASEGALLISQAADLTGLSDRQLERLAVRTIGLTPKSFARVTRLQASVRRMIAKPNERLADLAAHFGFTDQSYMTREFVKLAGLTPLAYQRMVSNVGFVLDGNLQLR